ncbi:MAG: TolC family protein [Gammaproteobacteria bacterium]
MIFRHKAITAWALSIITSFMMVHAVAEENIEILPEPFTLEQALAFADRHHPVLAISESQLKQAEAGVLQADASDDVDIRIQALAQWIDPAEKSPYQESDNHRLSLLVDKPLYDFGLQDAQKEQASKSLQAQQYNYIDTRQKRRLAIMRRFFDVLLADLNFYRYNEEMATAFVRLDKLRDRLELGQVSDLEVLQQDVEYQKMRRLRLASRNNQRLTRNALALSLGNPALIADNLAKPELLALTRKIPEVEELQKQALENNLAIKSLQSRLQAATQAVEMARKSDNAVIKGQLEAHTYSRETGSTDTWRAGVLLEVPLSKGGRTDAAIARRKGELYEIQSILEKTEMDIQQQVLRLWLDLESMQAKREEMMALTDYSELYLDKSRALYEMEVRSTLGDAMITVTKAQYEALKADLDMAYAWAKMDALTGNMIKEH